ncbi:hypothetical protein FRC00_009198, partial [Tulasnella sp. 408]
FDAGATDNDQFKPLNFQPITYMLNADKSKQSVAVIVGYLRLVNVAKLSWGLPTRTHAGTRIQFQVVKLAYSALKK